jgi:hypothetical protein
LEIVLIVMVVTQLYTLVKTNQAGHLWLTPVVLVTWKAEDQEDVDLRSVWANSLRDPHLQNNHSKTYWRRVSSGRAPAL